MKQRFGIAQLLLNNPKLIIVDEPTAGLDPVERNRFLNVLREISTTKTIIFSTHIVDDVKELCNAMAIMNGGRILMQSTPDLAAKQAEGKLWTKIIARDLLEITESEQNVISSKYNPDNSLTVRVFSNTMPGVDFESAENITLEDVYFIALKDESLI